MLAVRCLLAFLLLASAGCASFRGEKLPQLERSELTAENRMPAITYTWNPGVSAPGMSWNMAFTGSSSEWLFRSAFVDARSAPGRVGIRVVDANGRLVRKIDEHRVAGTHEIHWDGQDQQGRAVPAGILFYEVIAGADRKTGRLVRLSQ